MQGVTSPKVEPQYRVAVLRDVAGWILRARSSASAVLHNLFAQALLFALYFGTGIIVARGLGSAGRGELTAMTVWPALFGAIFSLGLPSAYVYYVRRNPELESSLFGTALFLSLGLSGIAIGAAEIALPHYLWRYDAEVVRVAQLLVFTIPQILLGFLLGAFAQVRHRFDVYNFLQCGPTLVTMISLIVLWRTGRLTPVAAALAYVLPSLVVSLGVFVLIGKRVRLGLGDLRENARRLMGYGARAAGGNILGVIAQQIDQVLVVGFLTPSQLGTYTVALSISRILNIVFGATYIAIVSRAAALNGLELSALVGRALRLTLIASLAASVVLWALLPFILPRVYGGEFLASIPAANILVLEADVAGCATLVTVAFLASNRPGTVTFLQGASMLLTVGLMFISLPRLGLQGAALSLLAGSTFRLIVFLALYRRVIGAPARSLLVGASGDVRYLLGVVRGQLRGSAS